MISPPLSNYLNNNNNQTSGVKDKINTGEMIKEVG